MSEIGQRYKLCILVLYYRPPFAYQLLSTLFQIFYSTQCSIALDSVLHFIQSRTGLRSTLSLALSQSEDRRHFVVGARNGAHTVLKENSARSYRPIRSLHSHHEIAIKIAGLPATQLQML